MGEKTIPFEENTETKQKTYKSLWNVSPNFFSFSSHHGTFEYNWLKISVQRVLKLLGEMVPPLNQ